MSGQNEFFGDHEQVRNRLKQLLELSQDPQYDQYLNQMMRDLDSGRAEPWQVEREARRSYGVYQQRMRDMQNAAVQGKQAGHTVEFKVGIHLFSMIGAVFVLAAFVIFSFNFLNGMWQGICLYAAAVVLILLSEAVLYRKMPAFSRAITGIGVGWLYIAGIVNYLVLHTVSGPVAMLITLVAAVGTILYGRKRESTTIRLIGLLGYFICLLAIGKFMNDLDFLFFVGILFIINMVCVIVQNEKNRLAINIVHLTANLFFMAVVTEMAWSGEIGAMYLTIYLVTVFIVIDFMSYVQCKDKKDGGLFPYICIGNGLCLLVLFLIGNLGTGMQEPDAALFVHLIAEVLILMVCTLCFLFWDKDDKRKWIQFYYGVLTVVCLGSFSEYGLEMVISLLAAFLIVKLFNRQKELVVLECVLAAWIVLEALWHSDCWYCWVLAGALVIAACKVHHLAIYHEIAAALGMLFVWWSQCHYYFDDYGLEAKWFEPVGMAILLALFLMFNHLPWLKKKNQRPYNIFTSVLMAGYLLMALMVRDMAITLIMMALGTIGIILLFGKRYGMYLSRRYFAVAIFLTGYGLLGCFNTPVVVSILLMAVALTCVGIGFKLGDKAMRIYGLTMAVFVCLKLVFYDFIEVDTVYRIIVFLVVGILALVISFLYILLEKKSDKKKAEEAGPLPFQEQEIMEERNCNDEEGMD